MTDIVYLLTNPAMPGLVKIGKTSRTTKVRMKDLFSTGVPVPFKCVKAVEVEKAKAVERALHIAFGPCRTNPKREFFEIDEIQAVVLLEQLSQRDVTPQVNAENEEIDIQSREAANRLSLRNPKLNFEEMSIPVGSDLTAINFDETATVLGPRKVLFRDEEMSLTRATRIMLSLEYNQRPTPHWRYQGELLQDIYNNTYVHGEA